MAGKRGFGSIRRLPSKRYQPRYTGPDGLRYTAPHTFDTKLDAEGWLTDVRREITADTWRPAGAAPPKYRTVGDYAESWLTARTLKPRTTEHYRQLLDRLILPTFADTAIVAVTADGVRRWHTSMPPRPTQRSHAYALLKAILRDAVDDGLIPANPAHIRGAGSARRAHKVKPATLAELAGLVEAMPPKYRALTLVAAWCGLRFGEQVELRRKDVDLSAGVLHVRRGAVRTKTGISIGGPKSAAGVRDVSVPPHLLPMLRKHVYDHAAPGREGLLFPAGHGGTLAPSTLYKVFYPAREAIGRPDLRWHDLRHTGAVLAASTGATLAELMARLGHSTPAAALVYQHAADGRDAIIAAKLSELANPKG
ncbi:site-specific integrase [Nakamurella sp. PAMC28650]|uniref:tyrosine-type recombinase/integrase n=1 Tax=Nakamurella sp. PAMC28650 TaxID=2762325 RepID=UPI00164DACC6|nr:site-specific integrase [Nakamurella sp. PAMC28650]QNK79307.1 site-specific integrase [Nakamurella sp. PAMC28650]